MARRWFSLRRRSRRCLRFTSAALEAAKRQMFSIGHAAKAFNNSASATPNTERKPLSSCLWRILSCIKWFLLTPTPWYTPKCVYFWCGWHHFHYEYCHSYMSHNKSASSTLLSRCILSLYEEIYFKYCMMSDYDEDDKCDSAYDFICSIAIRRRTTVTISKCLMAGALI